MSCTRATMEIDNERETERLSKIQNTDLRLLSCTVQEFVSHVLKQHPSLFNVFVVHA